jgi:serine/threonine-protein kinase RsbT
VAGNADPGSSAVRVSSPADVERIRRDSRCLARRIGFAEEDAEAIVLAVSELATNLVRYAYDGELQVSIICQEGRAGIGIISRDAGPGIANVELALLDGYSTGSGLGSGLPAVRRLMDDFSLSTNSQGTCVEARKWVSGQSSSR